MTKIVHVSDTHLRPFFPESGDILIHSGDALNNGSFSELIKFRTQLEQIQQNFTDIILVPGNHDFIFEENFTLGKEYLKETIKNITVLHNESVNIQGLKIYGTGDQPEFFNWAFNKSTESLVKSFSEIPTDIQILITHCPPKNTLDYVINRFNPNGINVGSVEIKNVIPSLNQLKLHCFGHIHYSNGQKMENGVVYSNGSICDENYNPTNKEQIIYL